MSMRDLISKKKKLINLINNKYTKGSFVIIIPIRILINF